MKLNDYTILLDTCLGGCVTNWCDPGAYMLNEDRADPANWASIIEASSFLEHNLGIRYLGRVTFS